MSHISMSRLLTQAEHDVLERLDKLRKTRGVGPGPLDERDSYCSFAAAMIMNMEELDGDDNEQHGWGPK